MSWEDRFDRPVKVPAGKPLETLADARDYILALPKTQQKTAPVLTATEALLMAATKTGPILHAQIGMVQLINAKPDGRLKREPKPKLKDRQEVGEMSDDKPERWRSRRLSGLQRTRPLDNVRRAASASTCGRQKTSAGTCMMQAKSSLSRHSGHPRGGCE